VEGKCGIIRIPEGNRDELRAERLRVTGAKRGAPNQRLSMQGDVYERLL
jgi:hypothetical protein